MGKVYERLLQSRETNTSKKDRIRQLGSVTLAAVLLPVIAGNAALTATVAINNRGERGKTAVWRSLEQEPYVGVTDEIKGITWNIRKGKTASGKSNISGVQAELAAKQADFICLQEVRKSDAKQLTESLGAYTGIYDPTYVSLLPNREPEGNLLLISTRIARPHELEINSKQLYQKSDRLLPRSVSTVRIGTEATRSLVLFNTHLEARDTSANLRQAHEVNRYVVNQSGGSDVIGCADINASVENSETSDALTGSRLVAWGPSQPTFNNSRIDGFFSSKRSFGATSITVGNDRLSDHRLVTAVFKDEPTVILSL